MHNDLRSLPADAYSQFSDTEMNITRDNQAKYLTAPANTPNFVHPYQVAPQSYTILNNDRTEVYQNEYGKLIIIKNLSLFEGFFIYRKTYLTPVNTNHSYFIESEIAWSQELKGSAFYSCYAPLQKVDCIVENENLCKYIFQYRFQEMTLGKYLENIKSTRGKRFQEFCGYKYELRIFNDFRELIKGLNLVHSHVNYHGNICFEQIAIDDGFKFLPFTPRKLEYELAEHFGKKMKVGSSFFFSDQKLSEINYLDVERNQKSDIYALGLVLLQILMPEYDIIKFKRENNFEMLSTYPDIEIFSELIKKMIDSDYEKRPDCNQCLNLLNSAELLSCLIYLKQDKANLDNCRFKADYTKNKFELRIETQEHRSYFKVLKNGNLNEKRKSKIQKMHKLNELAFMLVKNVQYEDIKLSYDINLKISFPLKCFHNKIEGIYKILHYTITLFHQNYFHKKLTLDTMYFDAQKKFWFGGAEYLRPIEKLSNTKINYDEDFIRFLPPELDEKNMSSCHENYSYMKIYSFNIGMVISDLFYQHGTKSVDKYNVANEISNDLRSMEYHQLANNLFYLLCHEYEQRISIADINLKVLKDEIEHINRKQTDYDKSNYDRQSPKNDLDSKREGNNYFNPPNLLSSNSSNINPNVRPQYEPSSSNGYHSVPSPGNNFFYNQPQSPNH